MLDWVMEVRDLLHLLSLVRLVKALPGQGLLQGKEDVRWWIISELSEDS